MANEDCPFCAIAAGTDHDQVVFRDDAVMAFMDLYPATDGHLLVTPVRHCVGLADLDEETGTAMWRAGHRAARAIRLSGLRCEGVNFLVCDGVAAGQSVFHVHLHVVPRFSGDGIILSASLGRGRPCPGELRDNAARIRAALARVAIARP